MKRITAIILCLCIFLSGCGETQAQEGLGNGWEPINTMELEFAHEFSVDYYEGGYKLITLGDGSRFLVIPEDGVLPKGISRDIKPLYQPIENMYLAATSAMCLFDALDRLDALRLSGTREDGWYIEGAKTAMENGEILYAGKYSEPDYELILNESSELAIESTMIGHASEVKDKLEELGVPVLIDQSSHETHPLGRTEWIKLYAALQALRELGAELVEFSPLHDDILPENIHGFYLEGGYPELYAKQLSENKTMRESIRKALEEKLPCIAECGGFMYLTEAIAGYPMVNHLPGTCFDNGKLTRFGYITLRAKEDNLLCKAGEKIPAHEFHHWDCTQTGSSFTAEKANGRKWDCAVTSDTLYAGFPHFHFYANPDFALNFYQTCIKEKHRHD